MLSKMLRASVNNTTNPTYTDANFNQVSLLLHGDGTNGAQNNTFLDSSTNNFTITRNGNTTQGTNTPFSQADGYWSNYFTGSSSYLSTPNVAALQLGAGDFTVEAWVYPNYVTNTYGSPICGTYGFVSSQDRGWAFQLTAAGKFSLFLGGSSGTGVNTSSTNTIVANTWTHLAAVRSGTTVTLYVNGVANGTGTNSVNENYSVVNFNIATSRADNIAPATGNSGNSFGGNISNLRIVKGTAVYTSAFTPSTTPLTAITNTQLLTCQSNYFKDNSSNNFTLTATGTPSVQPFSPFAPTAAYSTSVNGGSMYFDGSGDYLNVPDNTAFNFGSGDFTVECWVYPTAVGQSGYSSIYYKPSSNNYSDIALAFDPSTYTLKTYASSNGTSWDLVSGATLGTLTANAWNYVTVTRSGTNIYSFLNGVLATTSAVSTTALATTTGNVFIGSSAGAANTYFTGYISNFRVVKGTAVYTATFTPPTAPLTSITNTSLLLSGTNAGIYDNAIKNDLETVGNAQVSTSVVKYGTGSMKFNGSTDYLTTPISPQFAFGAGNWTIEGWVYPSSVTILQSLIDTRATATSTTGVLVSITALGFISVTVNNAILFTSSTAMTLSTWVHVAVVQNGTTITLYLDGTKPITGSGTSSTSLTDQYLRLGASAGTAANFYNGYLDDIRITKGIARYTANFTAPTSAFPNS